MYMPKCVKQSGSLLILLFIFVIFDGVDSASASASTKDSNPNLSRGFRKLTASSKPHHRNQEVNIESYIESFRSDLCKIQSLSCDLTTWVPRARDPLYFRGWTLKDWDSHTHTHTLARYLKHIKEWPVSATAKYILPSVALNALWSFCASMISYHIKPIREIKLKSGQFAISLAFFQAPILLLLSLRTNRALDRLLEARRSLAIVVRSARTLMGIISSYILPTQPEIALLMGRYLAILGWALKGMLRDESDTELINAVFGEKYQREADWIIGRRADGEKCPMILICRLRKLFSIVANEKSGKGVTTVPPIIILRIEEVLHQIEAAVGACNRLITSPTPPTYASHTSRVLFLYLGALPPALLTMNAPTVTVVFSSIFATYVLVGLDEIGCFIEHPFPLIPLKQLSNILQNEVEKQLSMIRTMPEQ